MKRKKYTIEQIIGILREVDATGNLAASWFVLPNDLVERPTTVSVPRTVAAQQRGTAARTQCSTNQSTYPALVAYSANSLLRLSRRCRAERSEGFNFTNSSRCLISI